MNSIDTAIPAIDHPLTIGPFDAAGAPFVITTGDADLAAELGGLLADLRARSEPVDRVPVELLVAARGPAWLSHRWGLWRDGEACETTVTDAYIRSYVVWEITRLVLETAAPRIPVHAAAMALGGRGVVLAGESRVGKTTLAGWLAAHGWRFLTDEVALLRRVDGRMWSIDPFPRPLGIRRPSPLERFLDGQLDDSEVPVPASRLGRIGAGATLDAIVLIDRSGDRAAEPTPAAAPTAVRLLAQHLPGSRRIGRAEFRAVVDLVEAVPVWQLDVADLHRATEQLMRLIQPAERLDER